MATDLILIVVGVVLILAGLAKLGSRTKPGDSTSAILASASVAQPFKRIKSAMSHRPQPKRSRTGSDSPLQE